MVSYYRMKQQAYILIDRLYAEGEKDLCMGNAISDILSVWQSGAMQRYKTSFVVQDHFPQFCLDKCYRAPRKKKVIIRKHEMQNHHWLADIKANMA